MKYILLIMCILSSCNKKNIDQDEENIDRVEDLLTPPHAIANVKNDDEYFFNYRLKNFAPSTEPLIKETFGNTLMFEEIGFWEHSSYTSHVVGFTTNLPAISIIEYGETADYGHTTTQSESYYYQHLHYIKGLESNKTYHYRFVAQEHDGITITSGDHTFTTKQLTDDVIRIPEDMEGDAPYILTKSDAKYVLTQDLTVPTMAINIKAHNVELDLDGHTIIYDNVPSGVVGSGIYDETATFGIRAGLWNFTNFKILNGIIKQGVNGGAGVIGQGYNPLFLNHMGGASYNEVAGITVDYYGSSIGGMCTGNGHVHHNVVYDRGVVIDNRHAAVRAISRSSDYSLPNCNISFNSLRRFRHYGIGAYSGKIEYNELYSDSFETNSFALAAGNNVAVSNNKIFGMGYLPIGIGWGSNLDVKGNFIYMRGFAPNRRSQEYDRNSAIAGMRITDGNVQNILYENNTIVLKPEEGCTQARGIWSFNGVNNKNIVYRRNTVKVEAMPGNLKNPEKGVSSGNINPTAYYNDDVNYALAAVTFSERAGNPAEGAPMSNPIIFEDNHLIGNVNLVVVGEGYGICNNVWMYRTKLEKINHDCEFFRPVRLGFWYWDTWNNRMVDTECTYFDESEMTPYFFGGTGKMEMYYGETKTLIVKNKTGETLANKRITLNMPDDNYSQVLQTDGSGKVVFDLLTTRHFKFGNSQEHNGVTGVPAQTDYQQYVFNLEGYAPLTISLTQLKNIDAITL
ncbi:MAG: fibronectin type III domain-containing protein [Prevotellaceae bacterium]|nr:fibronectin type III domain-containing protein [Prevotellaceae bacterium]